MEILPNNVGIPSNFPKFKGAIKKVRGVLRSHYLQIAFFDQNEQVYEKSFKSVRAMSKMLKIYVHLH